MPPSISSHPQLVGALKRTAKEIIAAASDQRNTALVASELRPFKAAFVA